MSKPVQKKFKTSDGTPKPLDGSRIENSLWLVKLPSYIADRWSKANQDEIVGHFVIGNKKGKPELYVQIPREEGGRDQQVPETMMLSETTQMTENGSDSMLAFSKDSKKDHHFRVDGKVTKRFNMKAANDAEANNIIRAKNQAITAEKKEIEVKSIDEIEQSRGNTTLINFGASVKDEMRRQGNANGSSSASAEKKEEMTAKFLEAFERAPYMKKDQIMTACFEPNVSVQDIQSLIDHYTKFHSSGRNKDHYELKSEFK